MTRIAVVEDNPDNRLLVSVILEDDFDVVEFEDGSQALAGLADAKPDLVLLDISLPGLDGMQVLEKLRQAPATASLPVIALTAHAMVGDRERYLAAGFDAYVSKPITDEDLLLDAIGDLLTQREAS